MDFLLVSDSAARNSFRRSLNAEIFSEGCSFPIF